MDCEASYARPYSELEVITNIIQHAVEDPRYEITARTAKSQLQNALNQKPASQKFLTIPPDLTLQRLAQTLAPSRPHRILTEEFANPPTLHKFENKPRALDPKKQVQCRSCHAWGHDGLCYMM